MECFITWQLEPKNSGLFDRNPILNSWLNKTNELKKKNGLGSQKIMENKETEHKATPRCQLLTPRHGSPSLNTSVTSKRPSSHAQA
ncbi:hypothetical protein PIB30_060701 [Stylosanthes scabra]|uniref:Uncharacterized protein n=1 Tax=Stylosanthes scabra TaxID=79078 RepID=A0ABU6TMU3_9FABA|nr:hypothetical protein [Stylosanthes scabra]